MNSEEKLKRRLHNAFKLSGFNIRREFCELIFNQYEQKGLDLNDNITFDDCIKNISGSLEKQNIHDRSIEAENIRRAIEACLSASHDGNETAFSIINAFDFPKLQYDPERKRYIKAPKKSRLLSEPNSKCQMFVDRYNAVLQRTQRNFLNKLSNQKDKLVLQTVDFLLTLNHKTLEHTLILGSLLQLASGKYCLEDPTGMVELDLSHAKYHGGFFVECCFVLVNGYYEDKILTVSTMFLPPGEEYKDSKPSFPNINYFGGDSATPLRESETLKKYMSDNHNNTLMFFSDVWLNHPQCFEKLEVLFEGLKENPPVAFVFMGNFVSDQHGSENLDLLRKLFKQFGELIANYDSLMKSSQFVFVPGMQDPCTLHTVPRFSLPTYITEELKKSVPRAIFSTNPCRLQYCNKEIVLFRADVLSKLMQATLYTPPKEDISNCVSRTIVSQGHLSPMSLNVLTVNWDFDYTLGLYPLPDLIVCGDKSEPYQGEYKKCQVMNPGSFCDSGFQFKCFTPYSDDIDDCML